jgi:class 3 adenylate cyclase
VIEAEKATGRRWSVRSKFLVMMLLTSLVSLGAITWLAYRSGKAAITEAAVNQLTTLRTAKKTQVENYFRGLRNDVQGLAETPTVGTALEELAGGYRELGKQPLSPERLGKLAGYYAKDFAPQLARNIDDRRAPDDFMPRTPAAIELQSIYIAENPNKPNEREKLAASPHDNAYTRVHARHHPWLARATERFGFYDLFLIDADGDIVYSVSKEADLGHSTVTGPVAGTNLAQLVREVARRRQPGDTRMADFAFYQPSANAPASFVASPIFRDNRFVGVLAVQISNADIDALVNDAGKWVEHGLGKSGSAYIIGSDLLMRSNFRSMAENGDAFVKQISSQNLVTPSVAQRMALHKTTVLYYPIRNTPLDLAFQGQSGTKLFVNQRGVGAFLSYAPLDIPDLKWAIAARMDEKEVLASQIDFNRSVMIVACTIALLVTLAALLFAALFLRPVNALLKGIERLRGGERGVTVDIRTRDEFNELVTAFNGMSETIRDRDAVIEGKTAAYEQLLKRIFPEVVADRMKQGDVAIVESFPQVTVVYAIIEGFAEVASTRKADEAIKILSEVVDRLDGVAEDNGVEKVKTVGDHYLAVSGLSVARLDSARRAMEFARLAWQDLSGINQAQGLHLGLRVGIATGPVQAGLVGSRRFVFDIWGYAASVARRIVHEADDNCVRLNGEAFAQLTDTQEMGEEIVVKMKSLGPVKTLQYRFAAPADAVAAQ